MFAWIVYEINYTGWKSTQLSRFENLKITAEKYLKYYKQNFLSAVDFQSSYLNGCISFQR